MRREFHLFFTALMFYTYIPTPSWVRATSADLAVASRYLPLVGLIVGGIGAAVFWLGQLIWPMSVAVLLSMIATIVITGAFHEDGLADCCDGFGGGWSAEQVLTIMKDSRLGTFGVLGLGLSLGLKFIALSSLNPTTIPLVLLAAHSLSRLMAISYMVTHDYARPTDDSKVKSATQTMPLTTFSLAAVWAIVPLFFLGGWFWLMLIPMGLARWLWGRYLSRRLGGYTGDCLGAAQQLTELVFYLGCAAQIG